MARTTRHFPGGRQRRVEEHLSAEFPQRLSSTKCFCPRQSLRKSAGREEARQEQRDGATNGHTVMFADFRVIRLKFKKVIR